MAEGPTVHRLARRHREFLAGQRVRVSSEQTAFADQAAMLDGLTLRDVQAWGKHLVYFFVDDEEPGADPVLLHVHLGLSGKFADRKPPLPKPSTRARVRIIGPDRGVDLLSPMICTLITPAELDQLVTRLGPDPLREDADPEDAWQRIEKSTRPIGSLIMDQQVIAGVGNIYRAEFLFRNGLDPWRAGSTLTRDDFDGLWFDMTNVMAACEQAGRLRVLEPEHERMSGYGRRRTYAYRRSGHDCRVCGTAISWGRMDGRSIYWCSRCQR